MANRCQILATVQSKIEAASVACFYSHSVHIIITPFICTLAFEGVMHACISCVFIMIHDLWLLSAEILYRPYTSISLHNLCPWFDRLHSDSIFANVCCSRDLHCNLSHLNSILFYLCNPKSTFFKTTTFIQYLVA